MQVILTIHEGRPRMYTVMINDSTHSRMSRLKEEFIKNSFAINSQTSTFLIGHRRAERVGREFKDFNPSLTPDFQRHQHSVREGEVQRPTASLIPPEAETMRLGER
ncbi:hypothetical protein SDJN02_17487, partial [Cucurbita argyrosperma subsp. argyrosperma]